MSEAPEFGLRMKEAIRAGGGRRKVARELDIPERTIAHYLSGRDCKVAILVAVADACGFSVEWLATGRGPRERVIHEPASALSNTATAHDGRTLNEIQSHIIEKVGIEGDDAAALSLADDLLQLLSDAVAQPEIKDEMRLLRVAAYRAVREVLRLLGGKRVDGLPQ